MKKMKIGVVPYMNALPLICGLEDNNMIELRFAVPALLPEMLGRGEIDAALVPSIEYFRNGQLLIIPDISIASKGAVRSVKLLVRNNPEDIKTVALDTASNTSCILSRIIMSEKYRLAPTFTQWNSSEGNLDAQGDAFLVIGDNALKTNGAGRFTTIDLGKEWQDLTHLPFVYAFWVTKRGTKIPGLGDILSEAKARGLGKLEELAVTASERLGLSVDECLDYLSENIRYDLGEKELAGLKTFYRYAAKMGEAKEGVDIEFYND